ncbi:Hypothetical protein A7982_08350 [Minicystis rosea]|nr:Hypothetical protein A7982_08350 [Minicystis rosea]
MSFLSCACHVFGITGYVNDEQAGKSNQAYQLLSGKAPKPNNVDARHANVKALVDGVRKLTGAVDTDEACIIYGGFISKKDAAPAHFWVEWNGYIYDTMPEHPLRRTEAKGSSRLQPPCENERFAGENVGIYKTVLTTAQLNNITSEDIAGPVWE